DVGLEDMELILTARSGRHAVQNTLEKLGFIDFTEEQFEEIFAEFLHVADIEKEVHNHHLLMIMQNFFEKHDSTHQDRFDHVFYELKDLQVISNTQFPSASVIVKYGDETLTESAVGSGPIDALYSALLNVVDLDITLIEYNISSVSRGKESQGKVNIEVEFAGDKYIAQATDTDVIKASALAYINAVNDIVVQQALNKKIKIA